MKEVEYAFRKSGVSIITGGCGTGKSTLRKQLTSRLFGKTIRILTISESSSVDFTAKQLESHLAVGYDILFIDRPSPPELNINYLQKLASEKDIHICLVTSIRAPRTLPTEIEETASFIIATRKDNELDKSFASILKNRYGKCGFEIELKHELIK